jgi:hypothetical protein
MEIHFWRWIKTKVTTIYGGAIMAEQNVNTESRKKSESKSKVDWGAIAVEISARAAAAAVTGFAGAVGGYAFSQLTKSRESSATFTPEVVSINSRKLG